MNNLKQFFFRLSYLILAILFFLAFILIVLFAFIRWIFTGKSVALFCTSALSWIVLRVNKV